MIIKHNVQSTAPSIFSREINIDTVYLNNNWEWIDESEDKPAHWLIDIQKIMSLREYIESLLSIEQSQVEMAQSTIEILELISILNEQQKIEQAQSNTELIELILSLQGGM